ncbi:MAG TPA: PspC domain-containing protein [Cellulomonas sp.]|uniref:PspC domain-containing protein n=1 Tax=Cellulomonas sp. TaxID=40001 RepID=UPI002E301052|nr:PspC domain-containing protein [Cellulomonas sp.]HEX5333828.1 PspC domain-containing protein [Cellulomonas sp.]
MTPPEPARDDTTGAAVPVPSAPSGAPVRPALRRPTTGRRIGGVAAGLAAHLGLPVGVVRFAFVVLVGLGGVGIALYVFLWVTVPEGDPYALDERPAHLSRLVRPAAGPADPVGGYGTEGVRGSGAPLPTGGPPPDALAAAAVRTLPVTDIAIALVLIAAAVVLLAVRNGAHLQSTWVVPTLILLAGTALAWSQLDAGQRGRWRSRAGGRTPVSVLRLVGGIVLAGAGVLLLVGQEMSPDLLVQSMVAALAVLAGVALVLAPWWLRLVRELGDERAARARESERADIAAHLHDSVLQTLALIRARADDPHEVARMARAQERELREWLYDDRPAPGTSLAAALRAVVAEIEDTRSGPGGEAVVIDAVLVGDREPDADTEALLQATREALVNAVVHGRPPLSLYCEVGPEVAEVFVRDRGDGFDLESVPSDRFGVRESIIGRIRRRGGSASVQSKDGNGTEVHLSIPVRASEDHGVRAAPGQPRPNDADPVKER